MIHQIDTLDNATSALEQGKVIFLPNMSFTLTPEEQNLLQHPWQESKSKNISFNTHTNQLRAPQLNKLQHNLLKQLMQRYVSFAQHAITHLFPEYQKTAHTARTSFRPIEAENRSTFSYRKDDRLLHVDAFPATPTQGKRILRFFSNVNPHGKTRNWNLGEPFSQVLEQFSSQLKKPHRWKKYALLLSKSTKSLRSDYDDLMLQLHHTMKADEAYQQKAIQQHMAFPSGSSWAVFTDQVSHAALAGQFCLEQTFLIPATSIQSISSSPLKQLEQKFMNTLV